MEWLVAASTVIVATGFDGSYAFAYVSTAPGDDANADELSVAARAEPPRLSISGSGIVTLAGHQTPVATEAFCNVPSPSSLAVMRRAQPGPSSRWPGLTLV